jgi:predicted DNA binding CopG/RHH family protein
VPQAWRAEASNAEEAMTLPATRVNEESSAEAFEARQSTNDRNLRSTSVTIRLSKAECARLHRRATEAGVTISAYMRSCTFEAETLRAQVKAVLVELKAAASKEKPVAPAKERRSWFGWLARLLTRRHSASQIFLSQ